MKKEMTLSSMMWTQSSEALFHSAIRASPFGDPSGFEEGVAAVFRIINANEDMGYIVHVF